MGVEDWESKYKLDDNLLDDYLEPEQKTWDDDDETKSEIYHIVSDPGDSERRCFYQTVECEVSSPEGNEYDEAGNSVKMPGLGSAEVQLVYKEAGSSEDETSPPEIPIIPSVHQLHQQEVEQEADPEAYKESLLYKTRMWAKTHIEDILENYAIYREKEEAWMRSEYESVESEKVQFAPRSEEDLDVVAFTEEDTQCEYDSYYSRKYISSYSEQPHSYYELRENVSTRVLDDVSPVMQTSDDYIDTMDELQKIVDTVTEYLAGREEEISKFEEMHKSDIKSNLSDKEKDKDINSDEVKEEPAVEQGISGVKNAMNSLFSSLVGTNTTGETTDTTAMTTTTSTTTTSTTTTPCSPLPLQSESGISKLLSFIPKTNGSLTPVAIVPPAHLELSADKKSPLQLLLPLQSSENIHPAGVEGAEDTANSATSQGSTASQSQSVVDSVLGRLSAFRIFGDKPAGEETSQPETPNKAHGSTETKEELTDKAKTLSIEQSASQPEHQSSCGGSCSGSVELLPETESSGEIPDILPREMTLKPEENPTTQKTSDETGFFSPFKKSLTSFMTAAPAPVDKTAEGPSGSSVFSIFKPTEAPKPEDAPATIGDKLKLSFFSSDTPASPQAPKQESGFLSGLLKLGPGEDATTSKQGVSQTSAKSSLLSRAVLLESVPKGNTDTGWFSNLFKTSPVESTKPQTVAKSPSKPTATINIPTVVVAPEAEVEDSNTVSKDVPQEDATPKSETDIQSVPENLTDTENEGQCVVKTETQADPSEFQDQAHLQEEAMSKPQGLLTVLSGGSKTPDKPQEGGLLSTLFSSLTSTSNESQAQQGATHQSTGLFSGFLKVAGTENGAEGNKPAATQQQPVSSNSQLGYTLPAGVQKESQEQKATSQKGLLAGLFSKRSEEDSSSKLNDSTASHINDANKSSVGKDLLSAISKSEASESSTTVISKDSVSTDSAALPQRGGILSGLFKLASDTVSSSPATPQQSSQPLLKPVTTQGSNQPPPQTATPPSHSGGLFSGLFKLAGPENVCATGNTVPDQQPEQQGNHGGQPNHKQPNSQSNAPPVPPQSGGIFGGILKLTESALAPSSTQQPSGTCSQPNQQPAEPSPTGGILSGFLNKISAAESTKEQPHLQAASQDPKSSQQSASAEQGSFLSGLFGISTSEANTGNQVSPQNVNSQQFNRQNLVSHEEAQPSGSTGILSGLFNKIVDTAQSGQSDLNQNTAQQPSPGLLSGLFSPKKPPAQQQKSPSGTQMNHQQKQQSNRQPLQRQHQTSIQPAAAPEPQKGGLFSGLFNKLASIDTPPQHPVAEGSPSQQACRSGHPVQGHQSPPASKVLTEVLKTSTVTTASKKISAEQQQPSIGLDQQSNRQPQQAPKAPPSPPGAAQQQSQSGGLLSSIFKMSASEELQQAQTQPNTQIVNKVEAQGSDAQESGILSGFFSKISAKAEDKTDCHIPSGQKPQQHEERKPGQNRPQIQRAKPVEQESSQDGGNEKDPKAPMQKGFLAGLFSKGSEGNSLNTLKESNEPKSSFSAGKGKPSGVFKAETGESSKTAIAKESEKGFLDQRLHKQNIEHLSSVTSISGSTTITQTQEPVTLHPAVKSTRLYLEEVHKLLYGTATEYGYQDLLYLFAEHGIVPPELYEHHCLIEALLWQQLNDYALLEALETQTQEYDAGHHEDASSNSHETVMQEPGWWNLQNMDPSQFHIPSYPWNNAVSSSFNKRLPHAEAEDDVVFDMSVKSRKLWGSCDNVDHFSNQTSRNHFNEKDSTGTPARLTRCQSLSDCSVHGKPVQNGTLKPQFDISKLIKRLTVKKGPIDLTAGAVDLSSFSATSGDTEDDMFFEDSEWYQQWLSLLEQGMWWPAEAGDCGYYIYADEDYIYSLLTDRSGKHLYAYATQDNRRGLEEIAENISNILQNQDIPKTTLCGFKIPLFNEDEMLWVPCHSQAGVSSSPVDLSSAFEKGDRIMNMNLECFSEMLQDSISGQTEHPVDLSLYKLQKIKVGKEPKVIHPKEQMEVSDLSSKVKKANNGGPYWKNQGIKDLFPGELVTGVSTNISSQISSITCRQHSSIRCHSPIPEIKIGLVEETNKKVLSNGFGAKTKDVDSSKMTVISNATNSNLSGSKIVSQNQHAQRKLPDAPLSSKASTNSARSLPATPRNVVTEPTAVTTTASQTTLPTPQRSASSLQGSSGCSSSAVSHRPRLGRQSSLSTQSLKTFRTDGVQSSPSPILPQTPKVAPCHEKQSLPPPQNLLYNRPKQALDSLFRSKPLDFSESLRNKVKYPVQNTTLLPNLSNDDIIIEDILDFTKNRLKKIRNKHQWTCQADTSEDVLGIDLTVDIKEEGEEINMTFPALEHTIPFTIIPELPLRAVSAPPSTKYCPPDSEPSSSMYRIDQHSSSSPSIGSKLVRQASVQCSKVSTTPEISGRKSINTSPKLSPKFPGAKADCGKDQKALIVSTHQGSSSSQPTNPEVKKYSTINLRSQSTQCIHQPSLLNESMEIIPTPPQPSCKSTAPANLVRNTLDMSSAPVVKPLDKPTAEAQVVPLVRRRRTSVADIGDGSFGVPLIVDPSIVHVKQIESHQETKTGEVLPLKSNTKISQVSPVLCRQQSAYNRNGDLSAHFSQSCQNVSAPANSIKTILDMCSEPAEEAVLSPDEAVSLVRRRSRSVLGIIEEFGGVSLVVEPLTTKVKSPLRRYQSQDAITKPIQQMVTMTSRIKSVTQHNTTLYSLALKGRVTTPANHSKATLDMSANLVSKTTEGTVTPYIVPKAKNVLEASEVSARLSSIMQHPTPEVKPLHDQSVETISQCPSQNAQESKTTSALTPANMVKGSLDMSLKPAGNTSSSEAVPLVKNNSSFNITGLAPGMALSLDRYSKDLNQTKYSGVAKLVKTNCNTDVQALEMFAGVPSMVDTLEQPQNHGTLHRELDKNQWQKQVLFDQALSGTPSLVFRSSSPSAQLANIPSAPANSIKNTLDMSLSAPIKEPDKAAGRILEMSPGKVIALVQTKNVTSKKDMVGMPLTVKAISAPEQVSQKQLQADKVLINGHHTAKTHLCLQTSTYHSDRPYYPSLKHNGESQAQSKPMDFSVRVSRSQCSDQHGQLMDFTMTKEVTSRNNQKHQQRLRTANQKKHAPIIDLTVALDTKTQMSGIKDLSMLTNSSIPGHESLTSLAMDPMLICATAQYSLQALGRQDPYITQSQNTYPTVQPAAPITSTDFRRTAEHLENSFNIAGLQILPEPVSVLSVEQRKTIESSLPQAQLTDNNLFLERSVISDGPPVFRPVSNSTEVLRVEQSLLSTSQTQHIRLAQTQGSNITRHPLIIPKFMEHDNPITQFAESNRSSLVRSKGLLKQSTVESFRESTIQRWVPVLTPTYVPEKPHALNTNKASEHTSVVTFGLISKSDGTTSIAGEDNKPQRSEGIQQRTGSIYRPVPDQQIPTHPVTSAKVESVRRLNSVFMEDTSSTTPESMVQSSMENSPTLLSASSACTAKPFVASCTVNNMASPVYTASPSLEFLPAVPLPSAAHISEPSVTYCPVKNLSSPGCLASVATGFSPSSPLTSPGHTAPTPMEFPPAVPLIHATHTAESSVTYSPVKILSSPGYVATSTIRFSPPLPLPSQRHTAPTPLELSPSTVESKAYRFTEPLPSSLPTPSLVHKGEPCTSVEPPVCTRFERPACTPVVPLPVERPPASLFPSTEHIASSPMEFSSPMLQNVSHTAPPPIVLPDDKQWTSPTPGSVQDRPSFPVLQRKIPVYHQSSISRHVSKAPTIIITEVDVESQEPSSAMLAQPEIQEKEEDILVSKTNCEPSLMISDTSINIMWNNSTSVVCANNIHITHMPEEILPSDDHGENCSQSSNSQEAVHGTQFASKRDISEGTHTDSDIFSQKQSTVGSISSDMLFLEEVPCFAAVSPTEVKARTLPFIRLRSRQMLIPQITLNHPDKGCPGDEETVSLHVTGDDACVSVTEVNQDTNKHSVLFEMSEGSVSVPEEHTPQTDENQIDSSTVIAPVASTEVSESNINVTANTFTSLTPTFSNTEEQVSQSLLVQDTTSHEKDHLPAGNGESMLIKTSKLLDYQNKNIFSFEPTAIIMDIMSLELVKTPEEKSKEKSELEDQKLSSQTSEIAKTIKEVDVDVSAVSTIEPLYHNVEHLTESESPKPKNKKGLSDFSEISDMSKEQLGAQARLHKLSSPEGQDLSTSVLSVESTLAPTAVPEEQSGKVIFSLFGGSQSGPSVLGGILPGASTSKETTGTSLFSMFGGGSPQQTQASSAPKEAPGKKLFSVFSGSNVQQPLSSCGPSGLGPSGCDTREQLMSGPVVTPGPLHRGGPGPGPQTPSGPDLRGSSTVGVLPTGQQPKESPGKGLFSMFNSPSSQQTVASGAPPRSPSPILGGILPGSSTPKDNTGSGLFSMFGGSSAQSFPTQTVPKCSNKEPAGKGLFSRFGGTASSESESLFKVPSVFSLGGGADKQKLSGFGLLSFMDDKKTGEPIPEDKATTKLEDITKEYTSVDRELKFVKPSHGKPKESEQDLPNNSKVNQNYETVSTETKLKSAHAVLNPEDGKIPEDKTTATSEVTHPQITESETVIKTVEHPTEEKQQALDTEKTDESLNVIKNQENIVIPEDKTLATFDVIYAQITETLETKSKAVGDPTDGQSQNQESVVSEKPLQYSLTKDLESDTGKETGRHTYSVESSEAEKSENTLESEKPVESDETIEARIPQKLNISVDYVSHTNTGKIPGTLEESLDREIVDNKIPTGIDEIPEKLEESWNREKTQNQDESEKGRSKTDKETDHAEQPKNDPCDGVVEKEPDQVKEQEETEKQLTNMPAQIVSEPLSAVIFQPLPQSLPETIRSLDKPKPRMVDPPGQLKLEIQSHAKPNMASSQRPPESTAFSGFMSMFSGPSASSKPATSSFFTSPQHSFFKLQPTGATCTQQQHKSSFFSLPTNLPAGLSSESLTGDLFGLLKTKDAVRPEETKPAVETCKLKTEDHEGVKKIIEPRSSTSKESSTVREPEAVASEQEIVKDCERSAVEPAEEERGDNIEITDVSIKCKESEVGVMKEESSITVTSPIPMDKVVAQEKHPSSPTAKSKLDLSDLSAPTFGGLLSGSAETAKPFSSLFGSSTDRKLPQEVSSDSGSLFASLKGLSAGLFQEEKPALPNEEPTSAPSMFGKKFGFPWQSTALSQTPSTGVTTQVENKIGTEDPEIETLSLESDVTESADSSDTEGPNDTCSDKEHSFDSSPEILLSEQLDLSRPGEEDGAEADPCLKEKDRDATDHAVRQLAESPLKKEHDRRLVGT